MRGFWVVGVKVGGEGRYYTISVFAWHVPGRLPTADTYAEQRRNLPSRAQKHNKCRYFIQYRYFVPQQQGRHQCRSPSLSLESSPCNRKERTYDEIHTLVFEKLRVGKIMCETLSAKALVCARHSIGFWQLVLCETCHCLLWLSYAFSA